MTCRRGGSKVYVGHQPLTDAACLTLAKHAGAYLIGKTVTAELATFVPNETRNPLNLAHTTADVFRLLRLGRGFHGAARDRYPDPRFDSAPGRLLRRDRLQADLQPDPEEEQGRFGHAHTVGLIARSVPDVALFAAGMLHYKGLMVADDGAGAAPRVGICRTRLWNKASPEMKAALENAAKSLSAAGAAVKDLTLPEGFQALTEAQRHVAIWEIGRSLAYELFEHGDDIRRRSANAAPRPLR